MPREISEYPPTKEGFEQWKNDNAGQPVDSEQVLKDIAADEAVEVMEREERRKAWKAHGREYNQKRIEPVVPSGEKKPTMEKSKPGEEFKKN